MEITTTHKTRDLYESSFLYSKHSESFLGTEKDGHDVVFIFQAIPCKALANDYYTRRAIVNAKDFSDAIRTCKDIVFSRLRERGL